MRTVLLARESVLWPQEVHCASACRFQHVSTAAPRALFVLDIRKAALRFREDTEASIHGRASVGRETRRVLSCARRRDILLQISVSRNCALSNRWPTHATNNRTWTELATGTLHQGSLAFTLQLVADEDGLVLNLGGAAVSTMSSTL